MVRFAAAAVALAAYLLGLTAHGSQIMLLDFSSPTCGPCRQMEPLIHAYEQAGYPIRAVDTSREPQLAAQYNVSRVPCFVMLVNGQEIEREIGAVDNQRLQQMFQRAKEVVMRGQPKETSDKQPHPQPPAGGRDSTSPATRQISPQAGWAGADDGTANNTSDTTATLINSTVRLRVDDGQVRSFGTGTIIDARQGEALVITCGHLFRESKGKGPVNVELFEATPGGVRLVGQVSGFVINYDLERDVALVGIRPGRPVAVAPIAPASSPIERGDRVVSVGCSNGQDPTAMPSRVTQLDRYQGPPNIEASGAPVEGRSGGGLFNDKGQLIGVCFAADYEGNEGLYAALESIHDEVGRLKLTPGSTELMAIDVAPIPPQHSILPDNGRPLVRGQGGQESSQDRMPAPLREPNTSIGNDAAGPNGAPWKQPAGFNVTEQAAWEEIMSRAGKSEVTIIVRPHEPGAESEVFTLSGASSAFVRGIAERQRIEQGTITR